MGVRRLLSLQKVAKVPGAVSLQEVPKPHPGPGEVVLRVAACGICGSDLHAYNQDPGYEFMATPVTLGHEYAGTVTSVGAGVTGWQAGDRAVVIAIQFCGACRRCRSGETHLCEERKVEGLHHDGGMAEYARARAEHLVPVPDDLDLVHAALVEPLSVALHCAADRTVIAPGDLVVVSGPGIIGLLSALVARVRGATVIVSGTGADEAVLLPLARSLGFETAVVGRGLRLPRKPDAVIEASGAALAITWAAEAVRRGGQVTLVGLYPQPVNWFATTAVREELTIRCSYGSGYPNYVQAIELMRAGAIPMEALVQRYPLSRGPAAFADALAKRTLKPLLLPDSRR